MKTSSIKTIVFWTITGFLCFELAYGALWDFNVLNKGYVYGVLRHLGYPLYLGGILGVSKLLAMVVILAPGLKLAKEWAYAGVVILFLGGFVSHVCAGDALSASVWSLAFGVIAIVSRILQPANRSISAPVFSIRIKRNLSI